MHPALAAVFARPIAHCGLHDAKTGIIENTRAAFAAAMAHGYGIECDIQPARDGEAMVFHDFTLDRLTTGAGRVDALSGEALGALPFRAGENRMEPLAALLDQVARRVPLIIEVKSRHDGNTAIATRIAELVAGYQGPLALKSFDPAMVIALREAGVTQPLGIVAMQDFSDDAITPLSVDAVHSLGHLLHFSHSKPDFLSWNQRDLPCAAPFLCRSQLGLPVMSWTIRSMAQAARVRPHCDQIVFEGFLPE